MSSPVSSLTASRSPSPEPPVQPDHFYGADPHNLPPSPDSEGKTYLSPSDDPLAHRGIPVFKPSMAEFADFEGYMNRVECWGRRSGIVKVVPPAEWTASLPDVKPQLAGVKIKSPIEQFMRGRAGLFRQENMEKRKLMSVREWAELCAKDEFRAPGVDQVGVHNNPTAQPALRSRRKKPKTATELKDESVKAEATATDGMASPPNSASPDPEDSKPEESSKPRNRRVERADKDASFLDSYNPHTNWLPPGTTASDYTPEFCSKLERAYWRNCGLGKPPWYGADTMGSLFTDSTTAWNVAHLRSTLSRLLPASSQGLPGVNTPYLYFGMWRATFAWHVEDMDLFSINYIHFGAPKFWYAVPQGRAGALEDTMRGYFPKDTSTCPQFLRHKSFLASPTLLAQSAVRPNHLVQHAGEFVITYPRGYHAGFNLGLNCAESVNFALDSWLDEGRKAAVCKCVEDSVRIDVDQLLEDRRIDALEETDPAAAARARAIRDGLDFEETMPDVDVSASTQKFAPQALPTVVLPPAKPRSPRKRKPTTHFDPAGAPAPKRPRTISTSTSASASSHPTFSVSSSTHAHASTSHGHPPHPAPTQQKLTLKLGPRPPAVVPDDETFQCCLCVDQCADGLVRVHDLPPAWREIAPASRVHFPASLGGQGVWMAHEACARVLPETWVDSLPDGERVVFGVDGIPRARWALKCSAPACTRARAKAHGALIQCAKGKCPKAFHIGCARAGEAAGTGIAYCVVREVEKEVVLLEPADPASVDPSGAAPEPNLRVLKVIKKEEVEALCPQHNPVIVASRRASKAEGQRADVLALPPLSRVKIRVSSGVFEVTLIRVFEDRRSVEVLWDLGEVREFKWNAIILGATSLPTIQFPDATSAPAPAPNAVAGPSSRQQPALYSAPYAQYPSARPQIPAPRYPGGGTVMNSPGSSTQHQQQQQPTSHNPYSAYNYELWQQYAGGGYTAAAANPYSAAASNAGASSPHSNSHTIADDSRIAGSPPAPANAASSNSPPIPRAIAPAQHVPGSHYVPQYYHGPQPWSSQYYRQEAYYPQTGGAPPQTNGHQQSQAPHGQPPHGQQQPAQTLPISRPQSVATAFSMSHSAHTPTATHTPIPAPPSASHSPALAVPVAPDPTPMHVHVIQPGLA